MKKGRSLLRWTGIVLSVAAFLTYGVGVQGVQNPVVDNVALEADVITIDGMKDFGSLERPGVPFFHDRHTEALEKKGKDCQTCHLTDEERLSAKFKRLADTGKEEVMNAYHDNCIGCHKEMKSAGDKTGPVECGECHLKKPVVSARLPMGFDKSLHYRHAKAVDNKCETCHHAYDERAKKLFYAKGEEGTCRYCHAGKTEENRISMRLASHSSCIACHQQTIAKKKEAGPVKCGGCHDARKRMMIEKVKNPPRMERKQPDATLVKAGAPGEKETAAKGAGRMNPVPFNHKSHEEYNDSCRVCHHADLSACNACHTQTGDKKGDNVTLAQAMHQLDAKQSCMGCHEAKQEEKRCAGCHEPMGKGVAKSDSTCKVCHMTPTGAAEGSPLAAPKEMAEALLASRSPMIDSYDKSEIPEKVVIKALSEEYEPAEMPHRKIVTKLIDDLRNDK
ncbi:MAG: cytochrome C, partial [Desulfobacterales bacterium]|nr:cytochrome C [Desulfobacterales bacterium]